MSRSSGELHDRAPDRRRRGGRESLVALLVLIPFAGLLFPAIYAKLRPELLGFPFFYWYQFLWVLIAAGLTIVAYKIQR